MHSDADTTTAEILIQHLTLAEVLAYVVTRDDVRGIPEESPVSVQAGVFAPTMVCASGYVVSTPGREAA